MNSRVSTVYSPILRRDNDFHFISQAKEFHLKIDSASFGEIEIDPKTIITFPQGVVGFEEHHQFKLLHAEDFVGLKWLQSITDEKLAFSIMEPGDLGYEYKITLSDHETAVLESNNTDELLVFLLVYEDEEFLDNGTEAELKSPRSMRASWRMPIILNPSKCIGYQKALKNIQKTISVRGD